MYECPNCREPQPIRYVMKPIWGTWLCAACGARMGIDHKRRLVAIGCVTAIALLIVLVLARPAVGGGKVGFVVLLATLTFGTLGIVALIDRTVLIDRTGMRCTRCGYDLQGQTEPRCPECGAAFDPDAVKRAESPEVRAAAEASRRRTRRIAIAFIVLFFLLALAGNLLLLYSRVPTAPVAPTPKPDSSQQVP